MKILQFCKGSTLHIADGAPVLAGVFSLRGKITAFDRDRNGVVSEYKTKTHAGTVISHLLGTLPSKVPSKVAFINIDTT